MGAARRSAGRGSLEDGRRRWSHQAQEQSVRLGTVTHSSPYCDTAERL